MNVIVAIQITIIVYIAFITIGVVMACILNQITKHQRNDLEEEIQGILHARVFIILLLIPVKNIMVFRILSRALRWFSNSKNRRKLQ